MAGPREVKRFYRQGLETPVSVAELLHVFKAAFNSEPVYHG
jgi:hypothetical protein